MTIEEINNLLLDDVRHILESRLYSRDAEIIANLAEDEEYVITDEELDAEFLVYKNELIAIEEERLRLEDLQNRLDAIDFRAAHVELNPQLPNAKAYLHEMVLTNSNHAAAESYLQIYENKAAEIQAAKDSVKYQEQRKLEYPSIEELIVALWEEDIDEQTRLEELRQAIKLKYPKPE